MPPLAVFENPYSFPSLISYGSWVDGCPVRRTDPGAGMAATGCPVTPDQAISRPATPCTDFQFQPGVRTADSRGLSGAKVQ